MKKEEKRYAGSIVLGLNDALVELIGALAGLTLALQNSKIIVIAGLITGIAASMSMAASEYLSTKADINNFNKKSIIKKKAGPAAFYTGFAYILTVLFLIFPYLILSNVYYSLIWALINAVIIIFAFTYYISIDKGNFKHRFLEVLIISLGVAAISFVVGFFVRSIFGVNI